MHTRRSFLQSGLGALATGAVVLDPALASVIAREEKPWFDISLAQWSLHRSLGARDLDNLDFARYTKETFGIHAVEYVNSFFKQHATDFKYLQEMRTRAEDQGVRSLLIMVDGEGPLAAKDDGARSKAIRNHFKWVAAAAYLGCHSIRVNAAGASDWEDGMGRAAESLRTLAEVADPYDINVIVENHGGLSSNGEWLAGVMVKADHPRVGTLPDFGNFNLGGGKWYDRYKGVAELMPFAKAVSAKSHTFDADGNETQSDYLRLMTTVKEAGYRGHVGVEYEGSKHTEAEGIQLTKDLLLRVRKQLDS
ncbi:xylose isomerase [Candidatus Woesearchaeota archaeon]|jgi:sugar phosphate isomerase/epimerase|nr:xylose isomerase [Candidatus Woesearchaeota archaeon]MDP6739336.1 TIM barrel protein [Planctomycetota bacterium]MDP6938093.1 TIM barrel protein [Planctomycetota bacterium]